MKCNQILSRRSKRDDVQPGVSATTCDAKLLLSNNDCRESQLDNLFWLVSTIQKVRQRGAASRRGSSGCGRVVVRLPMFTGSFVPRERRLWSWGWTKGKYCFSWGGNIVNRGLCLRDSETSDNDGARQQQAGRTTKPRIVNLNVDSSATCETFFFFET